MIHHKQKNNSFWIFLLIGFSVFSQNYKGDLSGVTENGFYKIILNPKVRTASTENFNSMRIVDAQKNEVPYVIIYNSDKTFSNYFPIKITAKETLKDSISTILIANEDKKIKEEITLRIANTDGSKKYSVYGSNDAKNWFGLVAENVLSNINTATKTTTEKTITLPLHNYSFLKIVFDDKSSLPINIVDVGFYKNTLFSEASTTIKAFNYNTSELKKEKVTRIVFTANSSHKISAIAFDIKTNFYVRNAKIITKERQTIKKRTEVYEKVHRRFTLSSKKKNTINLSNFIQKEFIIEIDNQDNPPLQIADIELLQKPVCLISNLKKNTVYHLVIDSTFAKPHYDLGNFISNTTSNIKKATITNFAKRTPQKTLSQKKTFWQTSLFMWGSIIVGSIIILYFSVTLLRDMGKE